MARLVLLHGFTQGPGSWQAVADELARQGADHELVRVTLPGHGGTGAVEGTFEDAAAELADAAGPAVWVGYSMGGRLALRVALDRPDLVDALVLLGASPGLADGDEREARRKTDETLASGLERKGLDRFLAGWLKLPLFERLPAQAAGLEERRANTVEGLASALRRLGTGVQEPLWGRLGELKMPVLAVTGQEDAKFSRLAEEMVGAIGVNAQAVALAGAGHAAHLERPVSFHRLLTAFLVLHSSTR